MLSRLLELGQVFEELCVSLFLLFICVYYSLADTFFYLFLPCLPVAFPQVGVVNSSYNFFRE